MCGVNVEIRIMVVGVDGKMGRMSFGIFRVY